MPSVYASAGTEAPAGAEVLVVGLNHRTAPLELIEKIAVSAADLPRALQGVLGGEHLSEAVVLSTCMRTEIYAVATCLHGAMSDVRTFLASWSGSEPEQLERHVYSCHGNDAVSHLFQVASGLHSAILGEGEILRQVRQAWEHAHKEAAAGPALRSLFRHSLEVGKRARSETSIARGTTSLSRAAVSMAAQRLGSLEGRKVLVVGAGEMGEGITRTLASARGIEEVLVANRTWGRAAALAQGFGGQPLELGGVAAALERADLVFTSTGATTFLVHADQLRAALPARGGRPLLIVDLAVPRDVDPAVGDLPDVTLLNLEDLKAFVEAEMYERGKEIGAVQRIVAEEVSRFQQLSAQRAAAPLVVALRDRAEQMRQAELDRYRVRLSGLDERQREAVEALTRGVLAKLLHEPTVQLKVGAGSPTGAQLAEATRILFDL
jgi:glutamyl-tRNA reductase